MIFAGKSVLITGGSSGIGAAIARQFAIFGAKVAIVGRNPQKLKNVEEEISKLGTKPIVIMADMTKDEDVKRIVNDTIKAFGSIDVLVNNAGMGNFTNILESDIMQKFDKLMATNFRSVVHITHLVLPHLIASRGNVVNISSMAGMRGLTGHWVYCCSKAALDMFTKCMASDLGAKGVRVNSVNPGPVVTDFIENCGLSKEEADAGWETLKGTNPLQRVTKAEEIADLVLFLASDKARGVTGSLYVSDNGSLAKTFDML